MIYILSTILWRYNGITWDNMGYGWQGVLRDFAVFFPIAYRLCVCISRYAQFPHCYWVSARFDGRPVISSWMPTIYTNRDCDWAPVINVPARHSSPFLGPAEVCEARGQAGVSAEMLAEDTTPSNLVDNEQCLANSCIWAAFFSRSSIFFLSWGSDNSLISVTPPIKDAHEAFCFVVVGDCWWCIRSFFQFLLPSGNLT